MLKDDSRPSYNRRLGPRIPVASAQLSWWPPSRKRFARKRPPETARLIDLSITGASVQATTDRLLLVGAQIVVQVAGGRGVVQIRRIQPGGQPDESIYGVEFVHLDAELTQLVNDTLAARRPEDLAWRWDQAR